MKRFLLGFAIGGLLFGAVLVYAGTLGDVTGDGQVGVPEAVHALQVSSGIKPSYTTASEITITSAHLTGPTSGTILAFTVPEGKTFILTDIVGTYGSGSVLTFNVFEDDTVKFTGRFSFAGTALEESDVLSLKSGIPFGAGTSVNVNATDATAYIMLSGYFIQNVVQQPASS